MPRPRFDKLDPKRQGAILDAAEAEFVSRGFSGASYNQIIERAGMSKGAMYYYFDDKEDLFLTVVARTFGGLLGDIGELGEVSTPHAFWGAVESMMARVMGALQASPKVASLARTVVGMLGSPDCPKGVLALVEKLRAATTRMVETGQRVGAVRADLPQSLLVSLFMAVGEASDVWVAQHWEELAPEERAVIAAKVMDVFRRIAAPMGASGMTRRTSR